MDEHMHHNIVNGEHSPREIAKFIAVIVGIIIASTAYTVLFGMISAYDFMSNFMGVFFIVFASFKLLGYEMFKEMFAGYDVIAKRFKGYAAAYPFIELVLGAMYLLDALPLTRDLATFIIMAISSIGVFQEIRRRSGIHCACLGNIIKLPLSTVSLVENVGMGIMALFMLLV